MAPPDLSRFESRASKHSALSPTAKTDRGQGRALSHQSPSVCPSLHSLAPCACLFLLLSEACQGRNHAGLTFGLQLKSGKEPSRRLRGHGLQASPQVQFWQHHSRGAEKTWNECFFVREGRQQMHSICALENPAQGERSWFSTGATAALPNHRLRSCGSRLCGVMWALWGHEAGGIAAKMGPGTGPQQGRI